MRIIGVLDLAGGRAVHARAGRRAEYAPVRQVAAAPVEPGDPMAVATAYHERLGIDELYAADLDAITGGHPQRALTTALAASFALWLDAGITSIEAARQAIERGAARAVIGLETLTSFDALDAICEAVGGDRVAFSLDLRNGRALQAPDAPASDLPPDALAARAAQAGAGGIIVLDLARVGTGVGVDVELVARVRDAAPDVMLIAGGGVRGSEDLPILAGAGCDAALVASALHDGRVTRDHVAAARRLGRLR